MLEITQNEIEVLRKLATEYMEYATLPVHQEKIKLWRALNRFEMQRPMILIDQIPYVEFENDYEELKCVIENRYWRSLEQRLRRYIWQWKHCPADMVLEPYITLPGTTRITDYGLPFDVTLRKMGSLMAADAQQYGVSLHSIEDVPKLQDRHIVVRDDIDQVSQEVGHKIFDGIAPIRRKHGVSFALITWEILIKYLGGMTNCMYLFYDEPEFIHACMRRMTDANIQAIKEAKELKQCNTDEYICHNSYVFTDDYLPDFGTGKEPIPDNCWAYGSAQVFSSTSPQLMVEFEVPYQQELCKYFPNICYGCCDRLDDRLDSVVRKIPNVRKVACTPWSDRKNFAENIGQDMIMQNKPNPAYLSSFDEEVIRKDVQLTCDLAKANQVNLELILKDISTIGKDPKRLESWNKIAMEIVNNY